MNTNETMSAILNRRSMRAYKSELPLAEELQAVLNAAQWAPSTMNLQTCHTTLVTNKLAVKNLSAAIIEKLDDDAKERLKARFSEDEPICVFYNAPAVFVISAENSHEPFTKTDVGITAQNICIAAKSFGIDTCINGLSSVLFEKEPTHNALKALPIPSTHRPMLCVAAGYGDMEMPVPDRKPNRTAVI